MDVFHTDYLWDTETQEIQPKWNTRIREKVLNNL